MVDRDGNGLNECMILKMVDSDHGGWQQQR